MWDRCPPDLQICLLSYSGESTRLLSGEAWFDSKRGRQTMRISSMWIALGIIAGLVVLVLGVLILVGYAEGFRH